MLYEEVEPDTRFHQRYAEMDLFWEALMEFRKAIKRALAAMQEVRGALEHLVETVKGLTTGADLSPKVKDIVGEAHEEVASFRRGDGYTLFNSALREQVRLYGMALAGKADRLKRMGEERIMAKASVEQLMKKSQKSDQYDARLHDAMDALAAKDRLYNAFFEVVRGKREKYAPLILSATMQATHLYVDDLARILKRVTDSVSSYLVSEGRGRHLTYLVRHTAASGFRRGGDGNDSDSDNGHSPVFSNVELVGYPYHHGHGTAAAAARESH